MSAKPALVLLSLLAFLGACGGEPAPPPEATQAPEAAAPAPEPLSAEAVAQLDSGSTAFRADDFQGALKHYTRASELAPDAAAAWFGVFMAQDALGNAQAAQEALGRAQALEPGVDLSHPAPGDTTR